MGLVSEARALHAAVSRVEAVTIHHYRGSLRPRRDVDPAELPDLVAAGVGSGRLLLIGSRVLEVLRRWRYLFLWPASLRADVVGGAIDGSPDG